MPKKPPHKMPIEIRAKQFLPFDALHGFREALAQKEQEVEQSQLPEHTPNEYPEYDDLFSYNDDHYFQD